MIYCNSVRVVDRSPRPCVESALRQTRSPGPDPIPFEPKSIYKTITTYRKKFPNVATIMYEHPENDDDDSYTIHIRGSKLIVDLESHHSFLMYPKEGPAAFDPESQLPPIPTFEHLSLGVHTLAAKLIQGPDDNYAEAHDDFGEQRASAKDGRIGYSEMTTLTDESPASRSQFAVLAAR